MSEGEQIIKLDMSDFKAAMDNFTKDLKEALAPAVAKRQEGFIQVDAAKNQKLVESLQKVPGENNWKLAEQWTVAIPNYTHYETRAGLRNHVWMQEILKGEKGDIAYIPYVTDADFEILSAVGDAFAAPWTNLVSNVATTLYEGGGYYDLPYYILERINGNLLEEINTVLAKAAIRSEDKMIMILIEAGTGTNFAGNVTRLTAGAYFYASNIPKALKLLLNAGKQAAPEECVLYLTSYAYGALLEEIIASQIWATAQPTLLTKGKIEELVGVKIVTGGYRPSQQRTNAATGTVDLCFLMRGLRAVALAPKRDLLIETEKLTATRTLRITASHTAGVKILDFKEIVRIWTSHVAK
jgi:hypothetical protein